MKFGSRDLLFPIPQVRRLNPLCHLEDRIADQAQHQTRDWPASGTYDATGTLVNLTATANTGFAFSNWTGSVANANSASTTVTMSAPKSVTANLTPNGPTTTSLVSSTNPSHVRPPPGAVTLPLPGFEQHGQQIAGAATNSSTRRRAAHR